jgi:hypothetical protein
MYKTRHLKYDTNYKQYENRSYTERILANTERTLREFINLTGLYKGILFIPICPIDFPLFGVGGGVSHGSDLYLPLFPS